MRAGTVVGYSKPPPEAAPHGHGPRRVRRLAHVVAQQPGGAAWKSYVSVV